MKLLKCIVFFSMSIMVISCGSSERVIAQDGKIYNVSGQKISSNGEDISGNLNTSEKKSIYNLVDRKRKLLDQKNDKIEALEKAINQQEKIEEKARDKQSEFKNQIDAIKSKINQNQDLRDQYVQLKRTFNNDQDEFDRLKLNNKLSPEELKKRNRKLKEMKKELAKIKSKF